MPRWGVGSLVNYADMAGANPERINDNAVDDTTTGVSEADTVAPNNAVYISAAYDLGSALPVDQIRFTMGATVAGGFDAYRATVDGTWTPIFGDFPGSTGPQSFNESFAEVAARYIRVVVYDYIVDGGPAEVELTDFRVYNNGVEYEESGSCVPPDAPTLFGEAQILGGQPQNYLYGE